MSRSPGWYLRRLRGMSPAELAQRVVDRGRQEVWARRRVAVGESCVAVPGLVGRRAFEATLRPEARSLVTDEARQAVVAAAEALLRGEGEVLGVPRPDIADPDWFLDPVTGRRAPQDLLAFRIDHRDEIVTGNVKSVWELSRHHHLTVLAAAWWLTHDERYADLTAAQLRSWWSANPFLSGIHWSSGIELGVRLTSWVWIRRLLDDWGGVADLFEGNHDALRQLRWHQEYLAAFRSRGSSANNHVIAEAVGRLVAASAFPWFEESERWRGEAAHDLQHHLRVNTFPSGLNREQASDYHRFVAELGLLALVETDRASRPLDGSTRRLLAASLDAAASMLDVSGRAPRQGDGDEGRGLVVDAPDAEPWGVLLSAGAAVLGAMEWWPAAPPSVAAVVLGELTSPTLVAGRPTAPVREFPDAGTYLLRTPAGDDPEIWCRCDGGPHGFLSIAAHGHADALSVEVRCDGVEILADPGTYCYHGEPEWRSYFRSTSAHNTLEVDGVSQSVEGGPFLWTSRADGVVDDIDFGSERQTWTAHHLGYARLDPQACHERRVELDLRRRTVWIEDTLTASATHTLRLAWHLGPDVEVVLAEGVATLAWSGRSGRGSGWLRLPAELAWSAHRGETDPVLGWYSPRFGTRVPSTTLVGSGAWKGGLRLVSVLDLSTVPVAGARTVVEATRASGNLSRSGPCATSTELALDVGRRGSEGCQ